MPRPPPQVSSAQKQNLAALSRAQSHAETTRCKLEAMGQELDRSFAEARQISDGPKRYGHWFARLALLPIFALAIGMVVVVVLGLWSGEIKELQKYSNLSVTRAGNPIAYWASVTYHSALASFVAWISVVVFRASRIGRKKATSPR